MVDGWTCSGCSTPNVEASLVCSACGLTRPDDPVMTEPPSNAGSPIASGEGGPEATAPDEVVAGATATPPGEAIPGPPAPASPAPPQDGIVGWVAPASPAPPRDGGVGWAALTSSAPPPDGIVGWAASGVDAGSASSAPKPIWRRIPVGWLVIGVLVLGGAVAGWYFNAGRSSSGEIERRGDLIASELRVGDCFDLKDPAADEVEDVTASPCTTEHEYEVIFVGSLPEGEYPAEAAFDDYVKTNCQPAFDAYIGKTYADSELDIFWFYPTDDAWRSGDRSVQCAAYHPRVHRLTDSLKGTGQ